MRIGVVLKPVRLEFYPEEKPVMRAMPGNSFIIPYPPMIRVSKSPPEMNYFYCVNTLFYTLRPCFFILMMLTSCSPARFVKPLSKKQHAANLALGGPLIKYGKTTIPIPFLTASYGYGIDSSLTAFVSLNVTSALFGNVQLEPGITKQIIKQNRYRPAISVSPVLTVLYHDQQAFKLYPQVDVHAYWEYGKKKNYFYLGADNWFEPARTRSLGERQRRHWFFTPQAGHSFNGKRWNINLEVKLIAPHVSSDKLVVEYQSPFKNRGAFGVYLGYTRKF